MYLNIFQVYIFLAGAITFFQEFTGNCVIVYFRMCFIYVDVYTMKVCFFASQVTFSMIVNTCIYVRKL